MSGLLTKVAIAMGVSASVMWGSTVTVNTGFNTFPNGSAAPYDVLVNGVTTIAVCDDYYDSITTNESWKANVLTLNNLNASDYTSTRFGGSYSLAVATTLYDKVAYLTMQFGANPTSDWAAIQTALWQVFDPNVRSVGTSGPTSSGYWTTQANNNYASVVALASRIEILTPIAGTQTSGHGLPQELIVITPEPKTDALFGAGLILLAMCTFRRSSRSS